MPLAVFSTNIDIPDAECVEFAKDLTHMLAERLHREEQPITVHVRPRQIMVKAGSSDPVGYLTIYSSRTFGEVDQKRETSQAILDFIKEKLKLPNADRLMVYMHKMCGDDIGQNGGLVSDRYCSMGQGGAFDLRWHGQDKK